MQGSDRAYDFLSLKNLRRRSLIFRAKWVVCVKIVNDKGRLKGLYQRVAYHP